MSNVILRQREIQLRLVEQTPLVRLLYNMFGNCKARVEDGRFLLSLDREPTESEKTILRNSDVNLKMDDQDGNFWITAETADATLTMYMCGSNDACLPSPYLPSPYLPSLG